jgi:hypothetical protein
VLYYSAACNTITWSVNYSYTDVKCATQRIRMI